LLICLFAYLLICLFAYLLICLFAYLLFRCIFFLNTLSCFLSLVFISLSSFLIHLSSSNNCSNKSLDFSLVVEVKVSVDDDDDSLSSKIVPNLLGWGDGGRRYIILNLNIMFF